MCKFRPARFLVYSVHWKIGNKAHFKRIGINKFKPDAKLRQNLTGKFINQFRSVAYKEQGIVFS
jgi:hypothetical protein